MSASSAGAPGARTPALARSTVGLKASGGTLSCVSQFVSVKECRTIRVGRGEDLRDRAAGVVRDEIDVGDAERHAELGDDIGETGKRQILVGSGRTPTVERKVDRDAAPLAGKFGHDVAPQVGVGAHAVDEQRRGAGAGVGADVDVADVGGRDVHEGTPGFEVVEGASRLLGGWGAVGWWL